MEEAQPAGPPAAPADSGQALGGVIAQFRVALANLSLYPAGSQQAIKACNAMFEPLSAFLDKCPAVEFSDTPEALLGNGVPVPLAGAASGAAEHFQYVIRRAGIKSLSFKAGLTLQETYRFLDWFHQRRLDKAGADAAGAEVVPLPAEGFPHISFNERVFVSVSEKDIVVQGGGEGLGRSGALDDVMKEVQRMMDLTQGQDPALRDKVRLELARQLVKSDPSLLAVLAQEGGLPADAPAAQDSSGNIHIPGDLIREIAVSLADSYRGVAAAAPEAGDALEEMKKAISRLLTVTSGREALGALLQELIATGGPGLSPGGAAPAPPRPEEAAERLVEGDSLHLLDDEIRKRLPEMLGALDLGQRQDLAEKLIGRAGENLAASTAAVRLKAAQSLRELVSVHRVCSNKKLDSLPSLMLVLWTHGRRPSNPRPRFARIGHRADSVPDRRSPRLAPHATLG